MRILWTLLIGVPLSLLCGGLVGFVFVQVSEFRWRRQCAKEIQAFRRAQALR